jgi:serine acetyltransferase
MVSRIKNWLYNAIYHYNHKRYWKYRSIVIDPNNKTAKWIKLLMLIYIKRADAFNNSSFGTDINQGAYFSTPPCLPHGPKGIIIGKDCHFGKNVIIFHHVTIASGGHCRIGDNVLFSTGVTVISDCKRIGDNAKIGANCVVIEDVPDNATVVLPRPRIILKEGHQ